MSVLNNPEFLRQVIYHIANEAYEDEVVSTADEEIIIGPGLDYENKQEWLQSWLEERFDAVKNKLVPFGDPKKVEDSEFSSEMCRKFYNMNLGDICELSAAASIVRVPGGWLYVSINPNVSSQAFIPFDNEFQIEKY